MGSAAMSPGHGGRYRQGGSAMYLPSLGLALAALLAIAPAGGRSEAERLEARPSPAVPASSTTSTTVGDSVPVEQSTSTTVGGSVPGESTTSTTALPTASLPPAAVEPARPPISRPVVVLYGDSLAWEAQDAFVQAFAFRPDVHVVTRTFGGTAICDWFSHMREDAAALAPGAVVVEFSGNALTPCMQDPAGVGLSDAAYLQRYEADAGEVVDIFEPTGADVFLVGAPISRAAQEQGDVNSRRLNIMFAQLATGREDVTYIDAGAAVLADGRWTATLPCLPDEPCTGGTDAAGQVVNAVRAPDGVHFCPVGEDAKRGVTAACPVWSSGAFRFAMAMAGPVLDRLASN